MGVEHNYRTKHGLKDDSNLTRGRAIRAFCIECMVISDDYNSRLTTIIFPG